MASDLIKHVSDASFQADVLDAGAPVGRAGSDDSRITVELRRAGRPVDIVAMIG